VGYVDIMLLQKDKVGPLNERQERYLERVKNNSRRLKDLIDDLLDISRIEAGSLKLNLEELDIQREVMEILQSIHTLIDAKQVRVLLNIPADLSRAWADPLRFTQVVTNLVSNACKYSPEGATVAITAKEIKEMIQVSVSDTGIGISDTDQSRLFTKFFRADNTSTREISGSGLGLFISVHLIEAHSGKMWVQGEEGKGSTFSFTLPRADGESSRENPTQTARDRNGESSPAAGRLWAVPATSRNSGDGPSNPKGKLTQGPGRWQAFRANAASESARDRSREAMERPRKNPVDPRGGDQICCRVTPCGIAPV
jgi:anti-sigma regulatory factor (Ser/Thr protein kinase)